MVNCQLRNDLRGVPGKWACSKAEGGGGGGGLTWPLILRIFGMVSITFFFAPPSLIYKFFTEKAYMLRDHRRPLDEAQGGGGGGGGRWAYAHLPPPPGPAYPN